MNEKSAKIILFGATGGLGRALIEKSLQEGSEVLAVVRHPEALSAQNGLTVVQGDVLEIESLKSTLSNHARFLDGAIAVSALGSRGNQTGSLAGAVGPLLGVLSVFGVTRIIFVTSFGVGSSMMQMGFLARYIIVPLFLGASLREKAPQEAALRSSAMPWTLVRPGNLTDEPGTGVYRIIAEGPEKLGGPVIARADVADFIAKEVKSGQYAGKAVGLSY